MFRLVAIDLDGTLLRSDSTVSPPTVTALARAVQAGARIVVATGRPPRFTQTLAQEAGLTGVAVCSNGAIVHDLDTQVTHILEPLALHTAKHVAATLTDAIPEVGFALETGFQALVAPGYGHISTRDPARIPVESVDALWSTAEHCVKLMAWSPHPVADDYLSQIAKSLPEVMITYSGGAGMIEVNAAGVCKASALQTLCSSWGITADEVIAFGDMPNDISMLEWAGMSVAMANAHPYLLAHADRITAAHDHDGVALVLEEIFA